MTTPATYIQHVNIMVDDIDAAAAFYGDFLGLERLSVPEQGFPSVFFRFNEHQEIHINKLPDPIPVRAHFALRVPNFEELIRKAYENDCLETQTWGKVRKLPHGVLQGFVRDPSGNLIELTADPDQVVSDDFFDLDFYDEHSAMFTVEKESA